MKKLTKKKNIKDAAKNAEKPTEQKKALGKQGKLFIIIFAAVLVLAGVLTTLMLTVITPLKPKVTDAHLRNFDNPNQTYLEFYWDEKRGASGYVFEYAYSLFDYETYQITTLESSVKIERVKGEVKVRIKSLSKYVGYDSDFSNWQTYTINGIKLDTPTAPGYTLHEENEVKYYTLDINDWQVVSYDYNGFTGHVYLYEVAIVAPGNDEEYQKKNPIVFDINGLANHPFSGYYEEEWYIFIRAINTKGDFGDFDGSVPDERTELYTLFEKSDWVRIIIS